MDKKRKTIITVIALALVLLAVAGSYSFFTGITNNDHKQEAKLATGTMALTFRDGNNGVSAQLMLGESVTKKFILKNTGSLEASLSLDWDQLINTYMDGSLTYRLVRTENNVEVEEIVPKTNMPVSKEKLTQTLASELSVPAEKEYYYDLIITFNSLDVDQEKDKTAVFNTHFNVGLPLQYRYYTLIVDPNGGTWKKFTTSQRYLLKNNETLKNITNPTRVGYTFDGWELKGTSSTFDSGTFTMGIADSSLTAKWTADKYTVTINPDGGDYDGDRELQADYGSTITLSTPTKTGHTFSHWETTSGTITNKNTLILTDPSDVTVTAIWTPNKYSYIIKHNKQNINDDEYTTFETETVENIDYGTEVTPEFKTYEGFTQPREKKTITIKEDNTLNVVEYNYDRIKYTLTVNPDGGTGGTTTQQVKYEGTVNLTAPTKVGYNFQKWTVESGTGTITDSAFKMGLGATTIKANWKAQEYSLTFNPNGGSVTTGSKKITYASTYGDLPIPTRENYVFDGWYTTNASTGGEEITSTTTVSVTTNQTLYARWIKPGVDATLAVLQSKGTRYTSTPPAFENPSTTNDGLFSMDDDYTATTGKQSYYFRGAVPDNYVKFGGFYWRIIRINGDGSLRIIYDGKEAYENGADNDLRYALTKVAFNTLADDNKYGGYMYGPSGTTASSSAREAQTNIVDSNAKAQVDNWYRTNMLTNAANGNADLTPYLADSIFCNDRSISATAREWWNNEHIEAKNLGFSKYNTAYEIWNRTLDMSGNAKIPIPRFICPDNSTVSVNNDKFTVNDTTNGNGALTYPVGLITADEIIAAGSGKYNTSNKLYYLYKSPRHTGWSLSPSNFNSGSSGYVNIFAFDADSYKNAAGETKVAGQLHYFSANNSSYPAIAPVINLKAEYAAQLEGSGTMASPYTVPGVN